MNPNNRRKITNALVDRAGQLRLAIPFLILLLIHLGSHVYTVKQLSKDLSETALSETQLNFSLQTLSRVSFTGMLSSTIFAVCCFVFWAIYSHRIFGPMVPFRRKIRSLIDGKEDEVIKLRRKDEFKYLASDLNELAERMGPVNQR